MIVCMEYMHLCGAEETMRYFRAFGCVVQCLVFVNEVYIIFVVVYVSNTVLWKPCSPVGTVIPASDV